MSESECLGHSLKKGSVRTYSHNHTHHSRAIQPHPPPPTHLQCDIEELVQPVLIGLYLVGCDGTEEVIWRHVHIVHTRLILNVDGGKVTEYLVRRAIGTDPVLVFYHTSVVERHSLLSTLLLTFILPVWIGHMTD